MTAPAWLEAAAARSTQEDWTLGHALEQYRKPSLLSREGLAAELGCPVETLHWLSLCRHPLGPERAQQLATIAARFRVSSEQLELLLGKVVGCAWGACPEPAGGEERPTNGGRSLLSTGPPVCWP